MQTNIAHTKIVRTNKGSRTDGFKAGYKASSQAGKGKAWSRQDKASRVFPG